MFKRILLALALAASVGGARGRLQHPGRHDRTVRLGAVRRRAVGRGAVRGGSVGGRAERLLTNSHFATPMPPAPAGGIGLPTCRCDADGAPMSTERKIGERDTLSRLRRPTRESSRSGGDGDLAHRPLPRVGWRPNGPCGAGRDDDVDRRRIAVFGA